MQKAPGHHKGTGKILVVEDSLPQAMILRRLLEKARHDVVVAASATEAMACLDQGPIQAVLSDVDMPGTDGYALCAEIKSHPKHRHLPVVLITALAETENILQGLQAQADYYLTKPFDPDLLLAMVNSIVRERFDPEPADPPIEIVLKGKRHRVRAGRRQVLNLLLSTYESAVLQNRELLQAQAELRERNAQLQEQSQRARVSERNVRALLENSADGMVVLNQERIIQFVNPAAQILFHRPAEQLLHQPLGLPFSLDETREVTLDHPQQGRRIAELHVVDTVWEGRAAYLATLRDITERKRDAAKVQEQQELLRVTNLKLQTLATEDGLTGLSNQRAFRARLQQEEERSARLRHPLSLVLLDVDHFKKFNDAYGHPAGDDVLKTVARILRENARPSDLAARYGGEEFVLLLPNTGADESFALAEYLRKAIASQTWPLAPITASFGVASMDEKNELVHGLVHEADKALYRSKQFGRNRVTHMRDLESQ